MSGCSGDEEDVFWLLDILLTVMWPDTQWNVALVWCQQRERANHIKCFVTAVNATLDSTRDFIYTIVDTTDDTFQ